MSKILVLNDFVSKGKIAGNMMEPVLTYMGHQTYFLPTALISNSFALGKVAVLDTTDHIKESFKTWDELGIDFDIIFIGFITNESQKDLIINYIKEKNKKPTIILDPIMADNGKLYNSIGKEKIEVYKEIMDYADIIIPNYTEASFLGLDKLDDLTSDDKKYLITSFADDKGFFNLGIDKILHKSYYKKLDINFSGTGDLMDALFLSYYLKIEDFNKAIDLSIAKMSEILLAQDKLDPSSTYISIEKLLYLLDEGGSDADR